MRLILATVEINVADGIALFGRQDVEIEDALVNLDVILLSPDILTSWVRLQRSMVPPSLVPRSAAEKSAS